MLMSRTMGFPILEKTTYEGISGLECLNKSIPLFDIHSSHVNCLSLEFDHSKVFFNVNLCATQLILCWMNWADLDYQT